MRSTSRLRSSGNPRRHFVDSARAYRKRGAHRPVAGHRHTRSQHPRQIAPSDSPMSRAMTDRTCGSLPSAICSSMPAPTARLRQRLRYISSDNGAVHPPGRGRPDDRIRMIRACTPYPYDQPNLHGVSADLSLNALKTGPVVHTFVAGIDYSHFNLLSSGTSARCRRSTYDRSMGQVGFGTEWSRYGLMSDRTGLYLQDRRSTIAGCCCRRPAGLGGESYRAGRIVGYGTRYRERSVPSPAASAVSIWQPTASRLSSASVSRSSRRAASTARTGASIPPKGNNTKRACAISLPGQSGCSRPASTRSRRPTS